MQTLKKGTLAYIDGAAGLTPCITLSVLLSPSGAKRAIVKVTTGRFAYAKGEIVERSTAFVVPRKSVRTKGHQFIISPYVAEMDKEE